MPYISKEKRKILELTRPNLAGDLNYKITELLNHYWKDFGPSYLVINEIVGALECSKQEFYRRIAVPYEEQKRVLNGDVY